MDKMCTNKREPEKVGGATAMACMENSVLFLCLTLFLTPVCTGEDKPKLVFNSDGQFKLAVFADCKSRSNHNLS